ncbi:hypothetical protein FQ192_29900 [Pseudomonas sp. ANT_J12]|jgi:hypothetical protein|uniref:hypothetical protein n=1 Tax=Pseudomonas sp. ANT_J12 TaxID=2597351 RepID=UPI0011F0BF33|nr:hypothetical protein [Pseudomonas sp. ANT_J12]KAA0983455.1 hypothetical protein FQ192_29900 [Pseudomonas sp. ANT_J12]
MNAIVVTPLDFATDEHFRTVDTPDFPRFIATSAFFVALEEAHLIQLVAVERLADPSHQAGVLVVREIILAVTESLQPGRYTVGGESDASLSIIVDDVIYQGVSGVIILNPQYDGKLGGSFHVEIEHPDVSGKDFRVEGDFNVQLSRP